MTTSAIFWCVIVRVTSNMLAPFPPQAPKQHWVRGYHVDRQERLPQKAGRSRIDAVYTAVCSLKRRGSFFRAKVDHLDPKYLSMTGKYTAETRGQAGEADI